MISLTRFSDVAWTEKEPEVTAVMPLESRASRLVIEARGRAKNRAVDAPVRQTNVEYDDGIPNMDTEQAPVQVDSSKEEPGGEDFGEEEEEEEEGGGGEGGGEHQDRIFPIPPLPFSMAETSWLVSRAYEIEGLNWGRMEEEAGSSYVLAYIAGEKIHERFVAEKEAFEEFCERHSSQVTLNIFPRNAKFELFSRRGRYGHFIWLLQGDLEDRNMMSHWLEMTEMVLAPDSEEHNHKLSYLFRTKDGTAWMEDDAWVEPGEVPRALWDFGGEWGWSAAATQAAATPPLPVYQTNHHMEDQIHDLFVDHKPALDFVCARHGFPDVLIYTGVSRKWGYHIWEISADQRIQDTIKDQIRLISDGALVEKGRRKFMDKRRTVMNTGRRRTYYWLWARIGQGDFEYYSFTRDE
jgi:hypothetical protein